MRREATAYILSSKMEIEDIFHSLETCFGQCKQCFGLKPMFRSLSPCCFTLPKCHPLQQNATLVMLCFMPFTTNLEICASNDLLKYTYSTSREQRTV